VLAVDGTVVLDGELLLAIITNLSDCVGGSLLQAVNQRINDIEEDDLVARVVQELSNEATADVSTT
jgi:uncharacterized membrane protein